MALKTLKIFICLISFLTITNVFATETTCKDALKPILDKIPEVERLQPGVAEADPVKLDTLVKELSNIIGTPAWLHSIGVRPTDIPSETGFIIAIRVTSQEVKKELTDSLKSYKGVRVEVGFRGSIPKPLTQ
jgi:hypothetical protein